MGEFAFKRQHCDLRFFCDQNTNLFPPPPLHPFFFTVMEQREISASPHVAETIEVGPP